MGDELTGKPPRIPRWTGVHEQVLIVVWCFLVRCDRIVPQRHQSCLGSDRLGYSWLCAFSVQPAAQNRWYFDGLYGRESNGIKYI